MQRVKRCIIGHFERRLVVPGACRVRLVTVLPTDEAFAVFEVCRDLINETDGPVYQGLRAQLVEQDGSLRRFVNVYVNEEDIRYTGQLATPLQRGDVVSILPAIAGGQG